MTISDGSDTEGTGTNPEEGGDPQPIDWDKVATVIRDTVGIDPDKVMAERAETAAAEARKEAGVQAQKTYDPRIAKLEQQLQGMRTELGQAKDDARLADIAKMPPEKQEAARELLKAEKNIRELGQMRQGLNEAAKTVATREAVLELREKGITAEVKDFKDCETPADMEAKTAQLRVAELERQLEEVKKGKGKPSEQEEKPKSPEASRRPAPPTGAGSTLGEAPWEGQKGKGFGSLAAGLRAQREAQ